jgi:hypothetical protein
MKAQIWSMDFAASLIVFLFVLVVVLFVWSYANTQVAESKTNERMQYMASSISDSLVRTAGFPEGWGASNVSVIGLAEQENLLSEEKVNTFIEMGNSSNLSEYRRTKSILETPYDFYFQVIRVNYTNGQDFGQVLNYTGLAPVSPTVTAVSERYAVFFGKPVKIKFMLWV